MRKDAVLFNLAEGSINIARFMSVGPEGDVKFLASKKGLFDFSDQDLKFESMIEDFVLEVGHANVRTFSDENRAQGFKMLFNKDIDEVSEIIDKIKDNMSKGLYSIINENIDIADGGVSGVVLNGVAEFAPADTPKAVEKPNITSMPSGLAYRLFDKFYGAQIPDKESELYKRVSKLYQPKEDEDLRIEFSTHPHPVGVLQSKEIIWEVGIQPKSSVEPEIDLRSDSKYPRFVGEKLFGLMLLDLLELQHSTIPGTIGISRNIPLVMINDYDMRKEIVIRSAPFKKQAGKYDNLSTYESLDVFEFMNQLEEGNDQHELAAIIYQNKIEADYSGSAILSDDLIIEGVMSSGDLFMLGQDDNVQLPEHVEDLITKSLIEISELTRDYIDSFQIEWVLKDSVVYIVQFNIMENTNVGSSFFYKKEDFDQVEYIKLDLRDKDDPLAETKKAIKNLKDNQGLEVIGHLGITSHVGDILRLNKINSKLKKED